MNERRKRECGGRLISYRAGFDVAIIKIAVKIGN